jgi:hypothetical protein
VWTSSRKSLFHSYFTVPHTYASVSPAGMATLEVIDSDPLGEWHHLQDLSKWELPTMRFVEAMIEPHKWVLPPVVYV